MSDTRIPCIHVCAGGRHEVLRRLAAQFECSRASEHGAARWGSRMHWDADQPTLVLTPPDRPTASAASAYVVQIETLLDELMHRHPWREQPLLDWTGPSGNRQMSVLWATADGRGGDLPSNFCGNLRIQVQQLQQQEGGLIKDSLLHVLNNAYRDDPALCPPRAHLLQQIAAALHPQIEQMLRRLSVAPIHSRQGADQLWPSVQSVMLSLEHSARVDMLDLIASQLAFRPDEQAYLKLLAHPAGPAVRTTTEQQP